MKFAKLKPQMNKKTGFADVLGNYPNQISISFLL